MSVSVRKGGGISQTYVLLVFNCILREKETPLFYSWNLGSIVWYHTLDHTSMLTSIQNTTIIRTLNLVNKFRINQETIQAILKSCYWSMNFNHHKHFKILVSFSSWQAKRNPWRCLGVIDCKPPTTDQILYAFECLAWPSIEPSHSLVTIFLV